MGFSIVDDFQLTQQRKAGITPALDTEQTVPWLVKSPTHSSGGSSQVLISGNSSCVGSCFTEAAHISSPFLVMQASLSSYLQSSFDCRRFQFLLADGCPFSIMVVFDVHSSLWGLFVEMSWNPCIFAK